jgi:hypothetical protein
VAYHTDQFMLAIVTMDFSHILAVLFRGSTSNADIPFADERSGEKHCEGSIWEIDVIMCVLYDLRLEIWHLTDVRHVCRKRLLGMGCRRSDEYSSTHAATWFRHSFVGVSEISHVNVV